MRFLASALAAIGFLWWYGSYFTQETENTTTVITNRDSLPRGIRNNNPLNIRFSNANNWQGQIGSDGEFVVFDNVENGIRAAAKLLNNYYNNYGLRTVAQIISRWSPSSENNTTAYIDDVASFLGVPENELLLFPSSLSKIIQVMIKHENGTQPYSVSEINQGIRSAGLL